MNLKLSITTALIALTTFPAFAKMERLGINQPAPGPIVGVGLGYLTLGGVSSRSAPVARGPQKRKELSAGAYFRSSSGAKSRTTPASARQARSILPRRLLYVGEKPTKRPSSMLKRPCAEPRIV